MSYIEWEDLDRFFNKEWRNESGYLHREDGPSRVHYNPDGSIKWEEFHIAGNFLGRDKRGFWNLWEILDEEQRQAQDILKCLSRYS